MAKPTNNAQLYKGNLSTIILKLLADQGRMYGYQITQQVKHITEGEVNINEGALYPALHKLEAEGVLVVEMEKVGNRMRKYYSITPLGEREVKDRLAEFEAFMANMRLLLYPKLSHAHGAK